MDYDFNHEDIMKEHESYCTYLEVIISEPTSQVI